MIVPYAAKNSRCEAYGLGFMPATAHEHSMELRHVPRNSANVKFLLLRVRADEAELAPPQLVLVPDLLDELRAKSSGGAP